MERDETEAVKAAAELLLGGSAYALMCDGKFISMSGSFSEICGRLGEERLLAAASKGGHICCEGLIYTFNVMAPDKAVSAVTVTSRTLFDMYPELKNCFTAVDARIRSAVTAVTAALDEIYADPVRDTDTAADNLETIDRCMLMLYSEVVVPDELMLYSNNVSGVRTDITELAFDVCSGIASASAGTLRTRVNAPEGCFAEIRPETLRIILSCAAAKAVRRSERTEYYYINISRQDGSIYLSVLTGSLSMKPDDTAAFDPVNFMADFSAEDLSLALIHSFCRRFGCRPYMMEAEGISTLGLIIPECKGDNRYSKISAPKLYRPAASRFSPERVMLAEKHKSVRYKRRF